MSKKKLIRAHYESRISPLRENYDILDWSDPASQQMRFQILVENVELAGRTLLDVGCGLGDLWAFLKGREIEVDYTGVDIAEKIVALARSQHPEARFECVDIFSENPFGEKRFDAVFCSGLFNLDLGNNREFLPVALRRLLELSRRFVVFNLLHSRARQKREHCVYYEPDHVTAMLRQLPCEARLLDDYLPGDFTVVCRIRPA